MRSEWRTRVVLLVLLSLGILGAGCGRRPATGSTSVNVQRRGTAPAISGQRREGRPAARWEGVPGPTAGSHPGATSPAPGLYDGEWVGKTSEGRKLSITVERNSLSSWAAEMIVDNRLFKYEMSPVYAGEGKITGGAFSVVKPALSPSVASGAAATTGNWVQAIAGKFDSKTTASGTLAWKNTMTGKVAASVTWKASRKR